MLSFALVYAGRYDGQHFERPAQLDRTTFYAELRPISTQFEPEALRVNRLDRERLAREGLEPAEAMKAAARWIASVAGKDTPVLVAYPLSFDWTWLYWYFIRYADGVSPFNHSRCYDLKTAVAVKTGMPLVDAGRDNLPFELRTTKRHSHHALDDAIEQAEIFGKVFEWSSGDGTKASRPQK